MSIKVFPDFTGEKAAYLALQETVTIPQNRVVMPLMGVFYAESLKMKDPVANRELIRGEDFFLAEIEKTVTAKSAKEAALFIIFINSALPEQVVIEEYQFVGGIYSRYPDILGTFIPELQPDFNDITDGGSLPVEEVLPITNLLRFDESSFGWEYAAWAIDKITHALLIGNEEDHELIRDKINALLRFIEERLPQAIQMVNQHIADYNNPHRLTSLQLDTYSIAEFDRILLDFLIHGHTAYDTVLFDGVSQQIVYDELRRGIDAENITHGLIPPQQLIGGFDPAQAVMYLTLTGWKKDIEIAAANEPIYYHGSDLASMYSTFQDFPEGTRVTMTRLTYASSVYYGNAASSTAIYQRETYKRTGPNPSDWTLIYF